MESYFLRMLCWMCLALAVQSACTSMPIVSVQLKWLQQAQFAGYFAAQEQGFYYDECLTVNLRPGGPAINIEDEVLQGRAQFGITWHSLQLVALNANKNVTAVAHMFQRVGLRLISFANSNIKSPKDFKGKKVCVRGGGTEATLRAAFVRANISWDFDSRPGNTNPPNNEVDVVAEYSLSQLTSGQCDVLMAQSYNEYAQLMMTEKSHGVLYRPSDINVLTLDQAMLEDMIIAGTDWLAIPGNEDIAIRFLRATFRGWIYSRNNPKESVNLFADKSALQKWQMNDVNGLTWPAPLGIGVVSDELLQQSMDIAVDFGLSAREWNVSDSVFFRSDLALAAHEGIEDEDVKALNFHTETMAFCLGNRGIPEICDLSVESSTSFVSSESAIGVVMIVVTLVGLVVAGVCAALLIYWREEKVIRSASLNFSLLMCLGAIIGLSSNFFHLERPVDGTCHARAWLLGIGFVTFFGNFLVKVWRIHAIFSGKVLFKIKVPDSKLYFWFSILCLIQVILLSVYSGVGAPVVLRVAHSDDYTRFDTLCVAQQADLWNLLFALYAICMLIYGVYLALQVRHIQSFYNEAKLLGASIYNVLFVTAVCGPILLFLDVSPTVIALINSLANVAMFAGSLAIVFAPRFFVVLGSPRFPKSETPSTATRQSRSDNSHTSFLMDSEMIKTQDRDQLLESRDQALHFQDQVATLIKAIDAELDRRSRGSNVISLSGSPPMQTQKLSTASRETQMVVLGRNERAETRGNGSRAADSHKNSQADSQKNSQNNSRLDANEESAARQANGAEKPENGQAPQQQQAFEIRVEGV